MLKISLDQIASWMGALCFHQSVQIQSVSIDSRQMGSGGLFFALKGSLDGHDYVAHAQASGAVACVVDKAVATNLPTLIVPNVTQALQQFARHFRKGFSCPVIAVTGSCGKTTTKKMLASVLSQVGCCYASADTLNGQLGVPLTVLNMNDKQDYAVIEMGIDDSGALTRLADIAAPTHAVITMAGATHLEHLKDLDGVARAKGELLSALSDSGVCILNRDDPYFSYWRSLSSHARCVSFGLNASATVFASHIQSLGTRGMSFNLHMANEAQAVMISGLGEHNVYNALAAAAAAHSLGVGIQQIGRGLSLVKKAKGRLEVLSGRKGCTVLDDSYNANPTSMHQALVILSGCGGKKILVVGDMAELGERSSYYHQQLGSEIGQANIDGLYAVGESAREVVMTCEGLRAQHFDDITSLIDALSSELTAETTVLVKGSRSAGMERVVNAIVEEENVSC